MAQEKEGIIGRNGSGKTTLLNMILGEEEGVRLGSNIKIAYLDQNLTFSNETVTLKEEFQREVTVSEADTFKKLARFHFYRDDFNKRVSDLSGGEKARLKLAIMIDNGFNFLILDEPTNHLDLKFREILEEALTDFDGSVLFISHDRYFLNKVADRMIELNDGRIIEYPGNFDYYLEKKAEETVFEKVKVDTRYRDNQHIKDLERELIKLNELEAEISKRLEEISVEEEKIDASDYGALTEMDNLRRKTEGEYEEVITRIFEVEEALS